MQAAAARFLSESKKIGFSWNRAKPSRASYSSGVRLTWYSSGGLHRSATDKRRFGEAGISSHCFGEPRETGDTSPPYVFSCDSDVVSTDNAAGFLASSLIFDMLLRRCCARDLDCIELLSLLLLLLLTLWWCR